MEAKQQKSGDKISKNCEGYISQKNTNCQIFKNWSLIPLHYIQLKKKLGLISKIFDIVNC